MRVLEKKISLLNTTKYFFTQSKIKLFYVHTGILATAHAFMSCTQMSTVTEKNKSCFEALDMESS